MSRDINYNSLKGDIEDIEEILLDEEIATQKIQKIKKKKRFDDGTMAKDVHKKIKTINRNNTKKI